MGRVRVTAFVFSLALLFPLAADAVAAPTLTSPANGAIVYGGQPTFSGTASTLPTDAQQVTVHVCNGFVSACTAGG